MMLFNTTGVCLRGLLVIPAWLFAVCAQADTLIYTPVNPTFGGNPNNASGLLNVATAQNDHKAPATTTAQSPLDKFNNQLTNAILSRLSTNAVNALFTQEGKLLPGSSVVVDNYKISVNLDKDGNLVLVTTDKTNPSASTSIVIGSASQLQ